MLQMATVNQLQLVVTPSLLPSGHEPRARARLHHGCMLHKNVPISASCSRCSCTLPPAAAHNAFNPNRNQLHRHGYCKATATSIDQLHRQHRHGHCKATATSKQPCMCQCFSWRDSATTPYCHQAPPKRCKWAPSTSASPCHARGASRANRGAEAERRNWRGPPWLGAPSLPGGAACTLPGS